MLELKQYISIIIIDVIKFKLKDQSIHLIIFKIKKSIDEIVYS